MQTALNEALSHEGAKDLRIEELENALDDLYCLVRKQYMEDALRQKILALLGGSARSGGDEHGK